MPTLILRMSPGPEGITKIHLSNPLRSQNLTLQYAAINKIANGYTQNHIFVRLPFASASQIHNPTRRGYLLLPTQPSTAGLETHSFGGGLPVEADNIPEVFECQLLDGAGNPLTNAANIVSVDLFFAYETHSLF